MASVTLGTATQTIEQRANSTRSNKIVVVDAAGKTVCSMDRPLTMSHAEFAIEYNKMIDDCAAGNMIIASMSAFHTAKRGQALDDVPSTFTIKLR